MITFNTLVVGEKYDRPFLAELWGYKKFNAISRGVVTPQGIPVIVLFVTREKQETLTQYEDYISNDVLFWEGEIGHRTDERIIENRDEVHVFFRDKHHEPFIYEGRAIVEAYRLFRDRPSKFRLKLLDRSITYAEIVADIEANYSIGETEREAIINARRGQGLYRRESIKLWKSCSLTGFSKPNLLVASHIKPWKFSSNFDRVNPYNSLLLVPTIDKLFDKGYISFSSDGGIIMSEKITREDYRRIHLDDTMGLIKVPEKTKPFLEYHREYIFGILEK